MRYKATVAYKGTNFAGWQIQNNAVTAQSTMQECISRVFKQDVSVVASLIRNWAAKYRCLTVSAYRIIFMHDLMRKKKHIDTGHIIADR